MTLKTYDKICYWIAVAVGVATFVATEMLMKHFAK